MKFHYFHGKKIILLFLIYVRLKYSKAFETEIMEFSLSLATDIVFLPLKTVEILKSYITDIQLLNAVVLYLHCTSAVV